MRTFIRLTELIPELLDMLDNKKLKFTVAYEISFLPKHVQSFLYAYLSNKNKLSLKQITRIRGIKSFPDMVTYGSNKIVWWKCHVCGYEWQSLISARSGGVKCLCCSGYVTVSGKNDLSITHPVLAGEWSDSNERGVNEYQSNSRDCERDMREMFLWYQKYLDI